MFCKGYFIILFIMKMFSSFFLLIELFLLVLYSLKYYFNFCFIFFRIIRFIVVINFKKLINLFYGKECGKGNKYLRRIIVLYFRSYYL